MGECVEEKCNRRAWVRGRCKTHYLRFWKSGEFSPINRPNLAERLWAKVDQSGGPDACWLWTGAVATKEGYGSIRLTGAKAGKAMAHRVAYELTNGPIPEGRHVLHRCDNPPCCNPAHLWVGTQQDNMSDMKAKGRQSRGERFPHSKLNADSVRLIRKLLTEGEPVVALARAFRVSPPVIRKLRDGKTWTHVP